MNHYVKTFLEKNEGLRPGEEPETIADYFDGQAFITACREKHANFGKPNTLYFALATDGVEYAKKPVKSLWPFTLEILNLPPTLRRKIESTIVVGVLFGYPSEMSSVLAYLVDELMSWNHEGWNLQFCFLIADTPALNKLLGFSGHSSMVKCPQHFHKGFYSPKFGSYYMPNELPLQVSENLTALNHRSNKNATAVPFMSPIDRLDSEVRRGYRLLEREKDEQERISIKRKYGIGNAPTPISRLPGFLYHTAATFETLHITLLGVGKLYLKLLCRDASLGKYPSGANDFELSEGALDSIAHDCVAFSKSIHPQLMPRAMRNPKDGLGGLRAEDFSNSLFLLPVLLFGRVPNEHVRGASLLVEAISLMSQTSLNQGDRESLDSATHHFLRYYYRSFYRSSEARINACPYVVHRFGDAPALLRLHGPGWTTWSFFVETIGGLIASSVKSMSNPEASLASSIRLVRKLAITLPELDDRIAESQRRRKLFHVSRANYQRSRPTEASPFMTRRGHLESADEGESDDDSLLCETPELCVPVADLVQLDSDGFTALFDFLFPHFSGIAEKQRCEKEMSMDKEGKYVATYRKLKANGFIFVSWETARPQQRHRCYAIANFGDGRRTIVQLVSFFHHVYKNSYRALFAYREAENPVHHMHVGEMRFRRWSECLKVGAVESILKPAAIVFRGPLNADQAGFYFYLRRVELLSRISFNN